MRQTGCAAAQRLCALCQILRCVHFFPALPGAMAGRLADLRPVLGMQLEMGSGAAMWAGDQFDLRQKLRLTRNLAVEVTCCAAASSQA